MSKISELTAATSVTGTELIPIVQSSTTKSSTLNIIKTWLQTLFAAAGANSDITSLSGLTTALSIAQGGTAATTASAARTSLGIAGVVQGQDYTSFTTGGTSTAYTLTPTPAITSLVTGQEFDITFNAAAGATPTLAISSLTAKSLKYRDSTGAKQAVTSTQVPNGWRSKVVYDGTDYVVREVPPVSASSSSPAVRQTVLSGPVDSNGFASFGGSTGSATLTLSGTITATAAAGGNTDYTGSITNPAFTSPGGAGTAYLHLAITSAGVVTTVTRVYKPIYIFGTGYSTTNAQWSFSKQEMTGKLGNGATAAQVYEVCIGHCTYSAGAWTGTPVYYAIRGQYFSQTATGTIPTTTRISASHNLGVIPNHVRCTMVCITAEGGYSIGNEMEVECMTDASNNNVVTFGNDDEYTMGVGAATGATYIWNKSTNALFAFTAGNWATRFYADRGW